MTLVYKQPAAPAQPDPQAVAPVDQKIDGEAYAQIAAQRRIHRDENDLHAILQRHVGVDHPVKDRLAVFGLADLEEWHFRGAFDEVAGTIDQEQGRPPAADASAKQ